MDRDTAVGIVARRLGNRTDLGSDIVTEMQNAQAELEADGELRPWFLLTENATADTTAGEERLAVPSDFLAEWEDDALWVEDGEGDWHVLAKMPVDDLRRKFPEPGRPKGYALSGGYFRLGPVPDGAYSVRIIYFKSAQSLSTNIENAWLRHTPELLIARTGMMMAAYLQNKIAYGMFEKAYHEARRRLIVENVSREMRNLEMTMGGA